MTNVQKFSEYKDCEVKLTVEMDAIGCYPVYSEIEFSQPNDKLFRELNEKSDVELSEIFSEIDWAVAYTEQVEPTNNSKSSLQNILA